MLKLFWCIVFIMSSHANAQKNCVIKDTIPYKAVEFMTHCFGGYVFPRKSAIRKYSTGCQLAWVVFNGEKHLWLKVRIEKGMYILTI
jgi:hypothetical protein